MPKITQITKTAIKAKIRRKGSKKVTYHWDLQEATNPSNQTPLKREKNKKTHDKVLGKNTWE